MNRGIKVLQTSALPLGYGAVSFLKERNQRTFNPRPCHQKNQVTDARMVFRLTAINASGQTQFRVSSSSITPVKQVGADYGARTRHLDLGKVALYQMS